MISLNVAAADLLCGIGGLNMVSTAPAVINAMKDACGVRIYDLPAAPER